jgi:hypothetical protein
MMKKYMFVLILFISFTLPAITPSIIFGIQDSTVASYKQGQFYIDITLTQPIANLS